MCVCVLVIHVDFHVYCVHRELAFSSIVRKMHLFLICMSISRTNLNTVYMNMSCIFLLYALQVPPLSDYVRKRVTDGNNAMCTTTRRPLSLCPSTIDSFRLF